MNKEALKKGKVVIAGAGPGDPELITYKAIVALRRADVVLTDRLVSQAILNRFVSTSAEIVFAGKQGGRTASASQAEINRLMIAFANKGMYVVRLKGGDVSIFSNVLEELETLKKHQVDYEIIPGITAASGAAAYSGIPLTARSFASSVRFLTCYKQTSFTEKYWGELAATDDTLVFYMTGENLAEVVEKLIINKISKSKLLAVIEQATTPLQNINVCSLYQYKSKLSQREMASPSLIIIGKVVGLHEAFAWVPNTQTTASYFSNIESRMIPCIEEPEQELLIA